MWDSDSGENAIDDLIKNDLNDLTKLQNAIEELEFHTKFYFVPSEKRYVCLCVYVFH